MISNQKHKSNIHEKVLRNYTKTHPSFNKYFNFNMIKSSKKDSMCQIVKTIEQQ